MKDKSTGKQTHGLFVASTGDEFESLFLQETGLRVIDAVEKFVQRDAILLVVLGGSIPMGTATAVSDVDFLVVTSSASAIQTKTSSRSEIFFKGHSDGLILAECIALIDGVEVDFQIVSAVRASNLFERICRGNAAFTQEELVILSRLATGWPLVDEKVAAIENWLLPWRTSLRVYCATRYFTFALKELEDAREAVHGLPVLALHLSRLAVEAGIRAYLATEGHTAVGSKWMRLVFGNYKAAQVRTEEATSMLKDGVDLMFSNNAPDISPAQCYGYLDTVISYLERVREQIEKDPRLKVAFQICPQIYRLPQLHSTPMTS